MHVAEPEVSVRVTPIVLTIVLQALMLTLLAAGLTFSRKPAPYHESQFVEVPPQIQPPPEEPRPAEPKLTSSLHDLEVPRVPVIDVDRLPPIDGLVDTIRDVVVDVGGEPLEPQTIAPRLLQSYEPTYPMAAIRGEEEGVVQVRVTIAPNGSVGDVSIEKSSGFRRLDEAALKAVRQWRFAPAMHGEQAIVGSKVVQVRFQLRR